MEHSDSNSKALLAKNILIVDDDLDFGETMVDLLQSRCSSVELAQNSQEAIERLHLRETSIALLDVRLGTESGVDLAAQIKSRYPKTRCIMVTAFADTDTAVAALQNGAHSFLRKPLNAEELFATVESCFETQRLEREREEYKKQLEEKIRLNRMIIDGLPCVAMLIDPKTCKIVLSNERARAAGAVVGETCYKSWMRQSARCDFCLADIADNSGQHQRAEKMLDGRYWDIHWQPYGEDLYLHYAFDVTVQRQAEVKMRIAADIIEHAGWGIAVCDGKTGRLDTVNPALARMHNTTIEGLHGLPALELFPEQDQILFQQSLAVAAEKGHHTFEANHRRQDQTTFPAFHDVSVIAEQGHEQSNKQVISIVDISRQKRTEAALRDSESRFRDLYEQSPLGYQSLDHEGRIIDVNPAWIQYLGYTKGECIGQPFERFLAPEMQHRFRARHEAFLKAGSMEGVQYDMVQKDGNTIAVEFHGRVGHDHSGEFKQTHCVFYDITARKRSSDKLKWELAVNTALADLSNALISESASALAIATRVLATAKNLTDSLHGFVSEVDPKNGNNTALTLTNMLQQCRINQGQIVFPPDADGHYPALWGHCLNTRKAFFTNEPNQHPQSRGVPQKHIPLDNFLSAPVILGKQLIGQIALANRKGGYNSKHQKAVEQLAQLYAFALQRHRDEQERLSLARQVRQAQKMEAIGTLAGGIAHDFNNLLMPMMGFAELVKRDLPEESENRADIDQVVAAGARAMELIKQILTFSRQTEEVRRPIELYKIVTEALKLVLATLPPGIRLHQSIDKTSGTVEADTTQMHQVLMNLCTNAVHAIGKEGGDLTVEVTATTVNETMVMLHPMLVAGKYVLLSVSDTGHGMAQEVTERAFEPFFSTKPRDEGTGLGLSVVHGIVNNHGGAVLLQSEVGLGTTIEVYLPQLEMEQEESKPNISDDYRGEERVLLIDDQESILLLGQRGLGALGYQVTVFRNPDTALQTFHRDPTAFDVIITDYGMPQMTGLRLAELSKAIAPNIPIILCTGYDAEAATKEPATYGISKIVQKPADFYRLAQAIREVCPDR